MQTMPRTLRLNLPPAPMSGGKIAAYLQLVGADPDPVVSVDGAGAIVVLGNCLWLDDLDNDLVQRRPA